MNDWMQGTTYTPEGGFFQRGLDGNPVGLTQGAFRGIGAGMQGAGQAMMQRGRPPGEMAMMGLAHGAQNAQRMQQPQMPQPQGQANGLLRGLFAGGQQNPQMPQQMQQMPQRRPQMGAFQFPNFGGGGQ